MRKISKKRNSKPDSSDDASSDDEILVKKKSRGEAGKKDGADDSVHEEAEENEKKSSKSRRNEKKSNDRADDKKKKRKRDQEEQSDKEGNNSDSDEGETLSKVAKKSQKKTESTAKPKSKQKGKVKNGNGSTTEQSEEAGKKDEEYEVEKIISHKKTHGRILYLIRWKGYGPDDDTWERVQALANCPEMLKNYTDEHPDAISVIKKDEDADFHENKDYEVEKILDVFFKKDKSREFLIRWKGYSNECDSWEPEEHLNCPELIQKYMAKVEQARELLEKELRPLRKHTQRYTLMVQANDRRLSKRHDGKQRAVYYDAEL